MNIEFKEEMYKKELMDKNVFLCIGYGRTIE